MSFTLSNFIDKLSGALDSVTGYFDKFLIADYWTVLIGMVAFVLMLRAVGRSS